MQLQEYFEFEKFDTEHGPVERIRLKGTRVAIEHVVDAFRGGLQPREILKRFPTLTLEQAYAAITYYLRNEEAVDAYIRAGDRVADAFYQDYLREGPYWLRGRALRNGVTQGAPADTPAHE